MLPQKQPLLSRNHDNSLDSPDPPPTDVRRKVASDVENKAGKSQVLKTSTVSAGAHPGTLGRGRRGRRPANVAFVLDVVRVANVHVRPVVPVSSSCTDWQMSVEVSWMPLRGMMGRASWERAWGIPPAGMSWSGQKNVCSFPSSWCITLNKLQRARVQVLIVRQTILYRRLQTYELALVLKL